MDNFDQRWDEDIKYYEELGAQYRYRYEDLSTTAYRNTVRKEYGKGGVLMSRGYYCPSLVDDIIISNVKRGKVLNKLRSNSTYDFIYFFDKDNRLIAVQNVDYVLGSLRITNEEFLVYGPNEVIGIDYNLAGVKRGTNSLHINHCKYDHNQIQAYVRISLMINYDWDSRIKQPQDLSQYPLKVNDILKQTYEYKDNILSVCHQDRFIGFKYNLDRVERFIFNSNETGDLESYKVEDYKSGDRFVRPWDDMIYPIKKQLKANPKKALSTEQLKEKLTNILLNTIKTFDDSSIYALSLYFEAYEGEDSIPNVYLSYNTESEINQDPKSEERWNYAYWLQNEIPIILEDEIKLEVLSWLKKKKVKDIGFEEEPIYDHKSNYIGKGPNGLLELLDLFVEIIKDLHQSGALKSQFNKEIPVILHDLEYPWYYIEATKKANPNTTTVDFLELYESYRQQ